MKIKLYRTLLRISEKTFGFNGILHTMLFWKLIDVIDERCGRGQHARNSYSGINIKLRNIFRAIIIELKTK